MAAGGTAGFNTVKEADMNIYGIIVAIICFLCIGLFHPIVIKSEYFFSAKCWPVFLAAGMLLLIISAFMENIHIAIIFGLLGCSCLWSIIELKQQEQRVAKGWFPANPKRYDIRKECNRKSRITEDMQ